MVSLMDQLQLCIEVSCVSTAIFKVSGVHYLATSYRLSKQWILYQSVHNLRPDNVVCDCNNHILMKCNHSKWLLLMKQFMRSQRVFIKY
jgi:hypothetical protein